MFEYSREQLYKSTLRGSRKAIAAAAAGDNIVMPDGAKLLVVSNGVSGTGVCMLSMESSRVVFEYACDGISRTLVCNVVGPTGGAERAKSRKDGRSRGNSRARTDRTEKMTANASEKMTANASALASANASMSAEVPDLITFDDVDLTRAHVENVTLDRLLAKTSDRILSADGDAPAPLVFEVDNIDTSDIVDF